MGIGDYMGMKGKGGEQNNKSNKTKSCGYVNNNIIIQKQKIK